MRSNYDLYNVINPVKVKINGYDDLDDYEALQPIIMHTPFDQGNDTIAIYDPRRSHLVDDLPEFEPFDGELVYNLPFSQIKDINPYMLLGISKAVKIVWSDFNPNSLLLEEIKEKTSLQVKPFNETRDVLLEPPIILPRTGEYLLLTDRTKMFEELEKLEKIIFEGDYPKDLLNIHFII